MMIVPICLMALLRGKGWLCLGERGSRTRKLAVLIEGLLR